jgi:hypothetical protein
MECGRTAQSIKEAFMLRRHLRILSLALAGLALATPALALNPQPLPPGYRLHPAVADHQLGAERANRGPYVLRCHAVQAGDPRKQPPTRVCP